jgi:hypothetical protein
MNLNECARREAMNCHEWRCTLRRDDKRSCAANEGTHPNVS